MLYKKLRDSLIRVKSKALKRSRPRHGLKRAHGQKGACRRVLGQHPVPPRAPPALRDELGCGLEEKGCDGKGVCYSPRDSGLEELRCVASLADDSTTFSATDADLDGGLHFCPSGAPALGLGCDLAHGLHGDSRRTVPQQWCYPKLSHFGSSHPRPPSPGAAGVGA